MAAANWTQQLIATGGTSNLVLGAVYLNGITFSQAFGGDATDIPYWIKTAPDGSYLETGLCDYTHSSRTITNRRPYATLVDGTYDDTSPSPADVPVGAVISCDISAEAYEAFIQAVSDLASHVADEDNPHAVTAAQAGADPAGTAAGAVTTHESTYDHDSFLTGVPDMEVSVPGSPSATGTKGQWARSGIHYYRCVATDTWMQFVGSTSGWTNE